MPKMSPIRVEINIRAARIPVTWAVREVTWPEVRGIDGRNLDQSETERVFWPQVKEHGGVADVSEIKEPLALRNELFRLLNTDRSESAALAFLDRVGAWRLWPGEDPHESWAEHTYVDVRHWHRYETNLRVAPVTVDELWKDAERWYRLLDILDDPKRLRAQFKHPPSATDRNSDRMLFAGEAQLSNTLPVSLEWGGTGPHAVLETVSAWELMIAAAWVDAVCQAGAQVCANPSCETRFTWPRLKKYCQWECGHKVAVRTYKRKKALEKRKAKKKAARS